MAPGPIRAPSRIWAWSPIRAPSPISTPEWITTLPPISDVAADLHVVPEQQAGRQVGWLQSCSAHRVDIVRFLDRPLIDRM